MSQRQGQITKEEEEIARKVLARVRGEWILYGDGIHDDTDAFQAWADDLPVLWSTGEPVGPSIIGSRFILSAAVTLPIDGPLKFIVGNNFIIKSKDLPSIQLPITKAEPGDEP